MYTKNYNNETEFKKYAVNHLGMNTLMIEDAMKSMNTSPSGIYTPHIVEERQMNMVTMSVFDRLMVERILWLSGVVNDQMSDIIQAQLLFLESVDPGKDIKMYLNTPGGSVGSGLAIVDTMEFISSDIETTNLGMCASMGSVILGAGTKGKRKGLINSQVMTHQVSYGAQGNIQAVRITQHEAEKLNYLLFKRLAKYADKEFDELLKVSEQDNWLNSDQAKEFGLIDDIVGLSNTESITEQLDGFDKYYRNILDNQK